MKRKFRLRPRAKDPALEPHLTVAQAAKRLSVSDTRARKMFRDHPNVLTFGHEERRFKRARWNLRIPESVIAAIEQERTEEARLRPSPYWEQLHGMWRAMPPVAPPRFIEIPIGADIETIFGWWPKSRDIKLIAGAPLRHVERWLGRDRGMRRTAEMLWSVRDNEKLLAAVWIGASFLQINFTRRNYQYFDDEWRAWFYRSNVKWLGPAIEAVKSTLSGILLWNKTTYRVLPETVIDGRWTTLKLQSVEDGIKFAIENAIYCQRNYQLVRIRAL